MTGAHLETALASVVGGRTAKALEHAFDMRTVGELLWHLPRRYSKRGELTPLADLPIGEHVTVIAEVLSVQVRRMQRRNGQILTALITDGTGTMTLTFFNQPWRQNELRAGRRGTFAGKVSVYQRSLQLQHPDYKFFDDGDEVPNAEALDEAAAKAWAEHPVPIYPATSTVASWMIQDAMELVFDALGPVDDPLPESLVRAEGILSLGEAFRAAHQPHSDSDWKAAWQSLRFREAFELQLALLHRRRLFTEAPSTERPVREDGLLARFDAGLPFRLTGDQVSVGATISAELAQPHPMHRLLQGEVGSGKTLVALRAMLQVAESGGQSALLAPTEVLAAQHLRSIVASLGPDLAAELNPVLITGRMPAQERRRALLSLASGTSRIAIGTHALLSEGVTFFDLGLTVIDEQHRFGVEQRDALRRKGQQPHVLAMTATPIPRTVALTVFGDLETITIRELPAGRQGIETFVVPEIELPRRAARVWQRAAEDIASGRQVYVVCPAISGGQRQTFDDADVIAEKNSGEEPERPMHNVVDTVAELRSMPHFVGVRIAGLSGDMPGAEKDAVMTAFAAGDIDMLIATTVIEVGMNVPNATIMVVRDADRFGVSQLHQLRGRVGRGAHPGLCLLMTEAAQGTVARERIEAVAATSDGFALAEVDLELRREGDILGTAQSGGRSTLKLLRVVQDGELIAHARVLADGLLERDPRLEEHPGLAALIARDEAHLDNLAKS